jgi:hypothetical protein
MRLAAVVFFTIASAYWLAYGIYYASWWQTGGGLVQMWLACKEWELFWQAWDDRKEISDDE